MDGFARLFYFRVNSFHSCIKRNTGLYLGCIAFLTKPNKRGTLNYVE